MRPENPSEYETTPDDDPRHIYRLVMVALDPSRGLNNGEPSSLAGWLDALDLTPGDRFLHVGCGVGYYSAIAAEMVAPGGIVVGIELDSKLAARACDNLADHEAVRIVAGDGGRTGLGEFDAIFVNAGATEILASWLDSLGTSGRLLLPLTVGLPGLELGVGLMLRVKRRPNGYSAGFLSNVAIFHCEGARTDEGEKRLQQAVATGDPKEVRILRRDEHSPQPGCWLHTPGFCLSRLETPVPSA